MKQQQRAARLQNGKKSMKNSGKSSRKVRTKQVDIETLYQQ